MVDERVIKVDYLARVEGEGRVYVKLKNGKIEKVEVGIFEAPRFFEAFLRGRRYSEVPDITARICGICPIAYIMSSSRAFEKLFGIEVPEEIRTLRRIIYLGEWIESHVLHIAMLHAPDFLGYHSIIDMAKDFPEFVKDSLMVKAWGNKVIEVVGGRPVHPVSCRVGGFHKIIRRDQLLSLLKNIYEIRHAAKRILEFTLKLPIPDFKRDIEYVSLRGDKEYPILEGRVVSNKGLNIAEDELEKAIEVEQVPYSTALRYRIKGRGTYVVGPIARFNNNYDLLLPEVRETIEAHGYKAPLTNTYQSIIARAAEVYQAVLELEELILSYHEPKEPYIEGEIRAGWCAAITEAPRGIL
ncbi:MAG TPA: Ni/Fe hydrogenase subunit alpha, partial [Desulfurococcaceae archaeon]|nr:Ni/Fe hydrogenase subunit alpha [Desulfurococcaceae archaeon]